MKPSRKIWGGLRTSVHLLCAGGHAFPRRWKDPGSSASRTSGSAIRLGFSTWPKRTRGCSALVLEFRSSDPAEYQIHAGRRSIWPALLTFFMVAPLAQCAEHQHNRAPYASCSAPNPSQRRSRIHQLIAQRYSCKALWYRHGYSTPHHFWKPVIKHHRHTRNSASTSFSPKHRLVKIALPLPPLQFPSVWWSPMTRTALLYPGERMNLGMATPPSWPPTAAAGAATQA